MEFFWDLVPVGLYYLVYGAMPGETLPAWYFLLARISPSGAYTSAVELVARVGAAGLVTASDSSAETAAAFAPLADRLAGEVPFYLEGWSAVAILVLWAIVPVAVGYLRFRRTDL
jgi:ABC-2 type transport system permease protein